MTDYIKVAVFTYPYEYAILKHVLEQNNIRFFFQNETVIGVLPFHSNALGGIFLKVHPEDIGQTEQILKNFKSKTNLHIV